MEELEGKFSLTSLSYRRDVRMKKTQIFCGLGHNSGSSHTAFNYSLLMAKKNKKVLYVAVGNNINTSIINGHTAKITAYQSLVSSQNN